MELGTILELDLSMDALYYTAFDYDAWLHSDRTQDLSKFLLKDFEEVNRTKDFDVKRQVILLDKWEREESCGVYSPNLLGIFMDCENGKFFYENAKAICSYL
jgi:hypothetical protein